MDVTLSAIAEAAAERASDRAEVAEVRDRTAAIVARLREITDGIGRGTADAIADARCTNLAVNGAHERGAGGRCIGCGVTVR